MKKINILLGAFLLTCSMGYSQTEKTEKADELFETYQYISAIEEYKELVEDGEATAYVYKQLGDSYYKVFNTVEAEKWYAKAVMTDQDAETYYRYAQVLKSQGEYDKANAQMDIFSRKRPEDSRAKAHLQNPNYIPSLADKEDDFTVSPVEFSSSEYSDFGPVLIANTNELYFVSTRNKSNKNDKWSNQPYLDIYKVSLGEEEPTEVSELNTKYHDGPVAVSSDGTMMIFSRDGHDQGLYKEGQKRVKVAQQGLYLAKKIDGKWKYMSPLSINSSNYSVSHPTLSTDGKTLYFASDMPGGFGDTDIWKASLDGSTVGTPENLGSSVNTPAKEGFPSIAEDVLYFSTNGRQGLGGFDVYKKDLTDTSAALNLGSPVNTNKDDFSFSMKAGSDFGYFASNRSGVDNIYKAVSVCKSEVIAVVKNSDTGKTLSEVVITIADAMGNTLAKKSSDVNGEVSFAIHCDTPYMLVASAESYKTREVQLSPTTAPSVEEELLLSPVNEMITDKEVKLDNIYFEFDKSFITERGSRELDKLVKIMKDNPSMHILVKSHTDSKGNASYNLKLSEERAQSTVQYLMSKGIAKERLSGKGMGSTDLKIDCIPNCTDEENAKNRRSEFIIVKK